MTTPSSQPTIKEPEPQSAFHTLPPAAAKLYLILLMHMDRSRPAAQVSLTMFRLSALSGLSTRWCRHLLHQLQALGFLHMLPRKSNQPFRASLLLPPPPQQLVPATPRHHAR